MSRSAVLRTRPWKRSHGLPNSLPLANIRDFHFLRLFVWKGRYVERMQDQCRGMMLLFVQVVFELLLEV